MARPKTGRGRQVSLYIDANTMPYYEKLVELCERNGICASQAVCRAVVDHCYQEIAGVVVSKGAYAAMADGKFDQLVYTDTGANLSERNNLITVSRTAYSNDPDVKALVDEMESIVTGGGKE